MPRTNSRPNLTDARGASAPKSSNQYYPDGFSADSEIGNQIQAAKEGFLDDLTLGLLDQGHAAVTAIPFTSGWYGRYSRNIAQEHARDQWAAEHYGTARTTGKVASMLVPLNVAGKVEAAAKIGIRVAQTARMIARERAAVTGSGAASGLVSQGAADLWRGHRGSIGDYAAAGLGGALEAHMLMSGRAGRAGMAGGAATSVMQDVFNGRRPSVGKAADAATIGGYAGLGLGVQGRQAAQNLPRQAKADLGEAFSRARTRVRGDSTASTDKKRFYLTGGRYTLPDQLTALGQLVESKFGLSARLSKNQKLAHKQPDLNYRVDHALPRDVGSLLTFPFLQPAYQLQNNRQTF